MKSENYNKKQLYLHFWKLEETQLVELTFADDMVIMAVSEESVV